MDRTGKRRLRPAGDVREAIDDQLIAERGQVSVVLTVVGIHRSAREGEVYARQSNRSGEPTNRGHLLDSGLDRR